MIDGFYQVARLVFVRGIPALVQKIKKHHNNERINASNVKRKSEFVRKTENGVVCFTFFSRLFWS